VRFEHPLLGAGALARLGPEERRQLHVALASALDDPVERARHLARSTIVASPETAAELGDAAGIAARRGLPAIAADLAAAAAQLTPDADSVHRRDRRLLEASFRAQEGSYKRAAELLDEVLPELDPGDDRARALRLRAKVTGDITTQRGLLIRALEDADDPATAFEANALLVRNYLYSGDLGDALAAARAGEEQARRTGDRSRVAAATTTRGLMEIWGTGAPDPDVLRNAAEFAREGGDLPTDTYSNPHTLLGARALYRYELDDARTEYEVASTAAEEAGDVDSLETFWWGLAQLEVRAGRYAAARGYVESLLESAESSDRRPLSVQWIEGVLATYEGRVEEARAALDETLARATEGENWFFDAYTRSAMAFLELSLGRAPAAVDVLEPTLATTFVVEGDPGQTGILPLAAEALIATGALDRAAEIVHELERRGLALDHPWCLASAARCRGLLLAERGETEEACLALDEALALYQRLSVPFESARTQLTRGSIQRRARQRRVARESLEAARDQFDALGTPLWTEKAGSELARIGGRAPSRGELTQNERRIAELVGSGMTNKEVAAELFVTERTVESALTQIYRKLDVRSRTELSRKLAEPV
jgi:DNA-binding NarL/FixJ family response regulator